MYRLPILLVFINYSYFFCICSDRVAQLSCQDGPSCQNKTKLCNNATIKDECPKMCKACNIPLICRDKKSSSECHNLFVKGVCHMQPRAMARVCQQTCRFCEGKRSCPRGWVLRDSYCYILGKEKLTWNDAATKCRGVLGANLVRIDKQAEQNTLLEIMRSAKIDSAWIGLTVADGSLVYSDWEQFFADENFSKLSKKMKPIADTSALLDKNGRWTMKASTEKHNYICSKLPYGFCNNQCGENAYCFFEGKSKKPQYKCLCNPGYFGDPKKKCSKPCHCIGQGDPHYTTYDNALIHFMGRCTYTFTRTIKSQLKNKSCHIDVQVKNEDRRPPEVSKMAKVDVSWTRYVIIHFRGDVIELHKNLGIQINGEWVEESSKHRIEITANGLKFIGPPECGLMEVTFAEDTDVVARLDRNLYGGKCEGLCGNCNGKSDDDFISKRHKDFRSQMGRNALIGNSWRVINKTDPEKKCDDENDSWPSCNKNLMRKAKTVCYRITKTTDSVFGKCAAKLNMDLTALSCYWDVCADEQRMQKGICVYYAYAAMKCREAGFDMSGWRAKVNCPMKCPKNSHYVYNMPITVKSCSTIEFLYWEHNRQMHIDGNEASSTSFSLEQREGCLCNQGFTQFGKVCIKHCGCEDKETGNIYKVGKQWMSKDCKKLHTCVKTKVIITTRYQCANNSFCGGMKGKWGCHCKTGFQGDGTKSCENINECDKKSKTKNGCGFNTECIDTIGSYICQCHPGYQPRKFHKNFKLSCYNIDECQLPKPPCSEHARCIDTVGSFECLCRRGYVMNKKKQCVDINECKKSNPCVNIPNSHCKNIKGGYDCLCNPGFRDLAGGKRKTNPICMDINECLNKTICKPTQKCTNLQGTYRCRCKTGFKMFKGKCVDIHECEDHKRACHKSAECVNTVGSYRCQCKNGFSPVSITTIPKRVRCKDNDECQANPCVQHADCTNLPGTYRCDCTSGYFGNGHDKCEPINVCKTNPDVCGDHANCLFMGLPNSYKCECKKGFTTDSDGKCVNQNECDLNLDNCTGALSHCQDQTPGFLCVCNEGTYKDSKTDQCIDINECKDKAFKKLCHANQKCVNTVPGYHCECLPGWKKYGDGCVNINECLNDPCPIDAECEDTPGSFRCDCKEGFKKVGKICKDINECKLGTDKCDKNAKCINKIGDYKCECKDGFFGNGYHCNKPTIFFKTINGLIDYNCPPGYARAHDSCIDIDECHDKKHKHHCHPNATCTNTAGSYICHCTRGFCGSGFECHDENECDNNRDYCHANATCYNNPGSFTCECNAGFKGNGVNCTDVDECHLKKDKCKNSVCINTIGNYDCQCSVGFRKSKTDPRVCDDIDECVEKTHNCDQICKNTPGAYDCQCETGYTMINNVCVDNNECDTNPCPKFSSCIDTKGSYTCTCNEGFRKQGDTCINIDECKEDSPCSAYATCKDNNGNCTCVCKSGYHGDGIKCTDVDECKTENPCDSNAVCHNEDGTFRCVCKMPYWKGNGTLPNNCTRNLVNECKEKNKCKSNMKCVDLPVGFACECASGFRRNTDNNSTCDDINECEEKTFKCPENSECANTVGSYTCPCKNGYSEKGEECVDDNECKLGTARCPTDRSECVNKIGTYKCRCNKGWIQGSNMQSCEDKDECKTSPCKENEKCENKPGTYRCVCQLGYRRLNGKCVSISDMFSHRRTTPKPKKRVTYSPHE